MALDTAAVETITVDSFTTLVDVRGSTRRALADDVDDPERVAELWRFRAVDYRMVSAFTGAYEDYEQTTREALEYALAAHGYDLPADAVDRIAATFHDLAVYPDVRPGIERLARGYDVYVLSNGTPDLLDAVVERAGIGGLIEGTISADEIRTYKPDPAIYEHAAERTDTPIEGVAHVAAPWYDVYGAMHAGSQAVWVNRTDAPWDRFDGDPDLTVGGFEELADAVDA